MLKQIVGVIILVNFVFSQDLNNTSVVDSSPENPENGVLNVTSSDNSSRNDAIQEREVPEPPQVFEREQSDQPLQSEPPEIPEEIPVHPTRIPVNPVASTFPPLVHQNVSIPDDKQTSKVTVTEKVTVETVKPTVPTENKFGDTSPSPGKENKKGDAVFLRESIVLIMLSACIISYLK